MKMDLFPRLRGYLAQTNRVLGTPVDYYNANGKFQPKQFALKFGWSDARHALPLLTSKQRRRCIHKYGHQWRERL